MWFLTQSYITFTTSSKISSISNIIKDLLQHKRNLQ